MRARTTFVVSPFEGFCYLALRKHSRLLFAVALVALVLAAPAFSALAGRRSNNSSTSTVSLTSDRDTYVTPDAADANFGSLRQLAVDGVPVAETFVGFDTSAVEGRTIDHVLLWFSTRDATGPGLSFFRVADDWSESAVTWATKPADGTPITTIAGPIPAGTVGVDVTAAFDGRIDGNRVSIRIRTSDADGALILSRENSTPPRLDVTIFGAPPASTPTPEPTPSPTATPSPSATASPTPSSTPSQSASPTATASTTPTPTRTATPTPTRTPSSTPTTSPTPTPTATTTPGATPTPSATPTPRPSETPAPTPSPSGQLYFSGHGTDHGVGMSQYGALGRARAGQSYDEILAHYYTDTTLGTIDPRTAVRVQLAVAHVPTAGSPARITALFGSWQSTDFTDDAGAPRVFPADSYVQLVNGPDGWQADVYSADGELLATATTQDVVIKPVDATTRFEMKWRDSLPKYTLYRGAMRLLVNGVGVQCINTVLMDDYLKGVVPAEMPPLWPAEAVKAQAVAARGYAYVRLQPGRVFDVVPTASNQVYGGVKIEHPRSNAAIDATANEVVMYGDTAANTFFFTVGGGYTENNEFAWVGNNGNIIATPIPYLRGQPDYDQDGVAYDAFVKSFNWHTDTFTWTQLGQVLARDARTSVGTLIDLRFDRGVSGRIYRVTIVGSARTVTVSGSLFKGVYNKYRLSGAALKSTMFWFGDPPR